MPQPSTHRPLTLPRALSLPTPPPSGRQNAAVLHSKKANKSFWDLGDFEADYEASRRRALPVLRELMERHAALAELQREREGGQTAGDEDEQHWQQPRPAVVV